MRKAFSIALVITTLILCIKIFAVERIFYSRDNSASLLLEESEAFWEDEADAVLMGEAVLNDFRKSRMSNLKLNTLCSSESIIEMDHIRNRLFKIIEKGVSKGSATEEEILAAEILSKAASADITGLTLKEEHIVRKISMLPLIGKDSSGEGLTGGALPQGDISLLMPGPAINMPGGSLSLHHVIKQPGRESCELKINPGRNFETVHADYYRLFLYMRDDTGDLNSLKTAHPLHTCFAQLFASYIPIIQIRKLQHPAVPPADKNLSSSITHSSRYPVAAGREALLPRLRVCKREAFPREWMTGRAAIINIMEGFHEKA